MPADQVSAWTSKQQQLREECTAVGEVLYVETHLWQSTGAPSSPGQARVFCTGTSLLQGILGRDVCTQTRRSSASTRSCSAILDEDLKTPAAFDSAFRQSLWLSTSLSATSVDVYSGFSSDHIKIKMCSKNFSEAERLCFPFWKLSLLLEWGDVLTFLGISVQAYKSTVWTMSIDPPGERYLQPGLEDKIQIPQESTEGLLLVSLENLLLA